MQKPFSLYVAGPLTHLKNPEIKDLYVQIGEMAKGLGINAIVPHIDIEQNADMVTPQFIYHADSKAVREADMMVAYVGETSLGVGMELEVANQNNTLFVLISEKGAHISRMVLGSPNLIKHIEFENSEDALAQLKEVFSMCLNSLRN